MPEQKIALITGANKGIGSQIAKDLAAAGLTVLVGSRSLVNGEKAASEIGPNAHAIQLDVTDPASIEAATTRIRTEFGHLDILVNNAGISHAGAPGTPFDEILSTTRLTSAKMPDIRRVYDVNLFGVIAVTQAMLPLLREAPSASIVNVSSGAGSLTLHTRPDNPSRQKFGVYSASKTALNAVTLAFAIELEGTGIKVNAVCPGFTKTDLNAFNGTQSVETGARRAVEMALIGSDGPHETFSASSGAMPW